MVQPRHHRSVPVGMHGQDAQNVGERHSHDGLSEEPHHAPLHGFEGRCALRGAVARVANSFLLCGATPAK